MDTITINTGSANLTEEQFFLLCADNKEINFERDKHKNIIIMSPTGFLTSGYEEDIVYHLKSWNNKGKKGYVTGPSGGYILPDGAMRAPDAAWIKKERMDKLSEMEKERFPHICPDFVVEVRSKSDSLSQLQCKMQEWIENGCRLGWLIDLENKTTFIYIPKRAVQQYPFEKPITGRDVLPGFELRLSEIL